jgi:Protein of unknown function (DUF3379)
MNCLDYRRQLASGEAESTSMKAHRLQCSACAELQREQARFEFALKDALQVPVPEGLAPKIERAFRMQRRRFLAAAGVSVAALGAGAYAWLRREDPLAMACIEFVMKEEAKSIMMGAMPRQAAEAALAATLPYERLERIGQVRHIGPCPFQGVTAYHAVLIVPQGKVTLLIMPEVRLAAAQRATDHGMYAAVIPIPRGSVGIVGADEALVTSVAGALRA